MSGLKGNVASLQNFSKKIGELSKVVAIKIAAASADALTEVARASFDAGQDPYGNAWEPGDKGERVTLKKSGGTERGLYYVAIGTKLRARFAVAYAKYQVGRRRVLPTQGDVLPQPYIDALSKAAARVIREELGR